MPDQSEVRRELAALMSDRRLALNLTWREVSERGNISMRVLSAVRTGNEEIRPLTRAGIERGLQWEPGSIALVLDGGDPVPLPGGSQPRGARPPASGDSGWMPPVAADLADEVLAEADQIWAALRAWSVGWALAHPQTAPGDMPEPPGGELFPDDPADARTWDDRSYLSVQVRIRLIAGLRAQRVAAQRREHGTG